jgi:thiamine-monophosphate kinase
MPLSEFAMIAKYFRDASPQRTDTILAIGDDAALIRIDAGHVLATCLLQWQAGVDYDTSAPGAETGRRLLTQAISDLEAKGVKPAWMTLSLSLEHLDEQWLDEFSQGLLSLANQYAIQLIGGDSTRGAQTLRLHLLGTSATDQMA